MLLLWAFFLKNSSVYWKGKNQNVSMIGKMEMLRERRKYDRMAQKCISWFDHMSVLNAQKQIADSLMHCLPDAVLSQTSLRGAICFWRNM